MEYGMIEARSIEQLVAVLNVQIEEGWEMAGNPVYDPRNSVHQPPSAGTWFAVIKKDPTQAAVRVVLQQYTEMMEQYTEMMASMETTRGELTAALDTMRRRLAQEDDHAAANPDKH